MRTRRVAFRRATPAGLRFRREETCERPRDNCAAQSQSVGGCFGTACVGPLREPPGPHGNSKRHQNSNDRDHHQQLDQREGAACARTPSKAAMPLSNIHRRIFHAATSINPRASISVAVDEQIDLSFCGVAPRIGIVTIQLMTRTLPKKVTSCPVRW